MSTAASALYKKNIMSSDVNNGEEDSGRYRGFDLDDADNDDEIDDTEDTTSKDRRHNNLSSDIGISVPVMQARLQNQARTISNLQENTRPRSRNCRDKQTPTKSNLFEKLFQSKRRRSPS